MTRYDEEVEQLREQVHCAVVLERQAPPWRLDRAESTKHCLKYRRGKGEILILNHEGRGWWDPQSDAKGDVFDLVQHFCPHLSFGHIRKVLHEFMGISPSFPEAHRSSDSDPPRAIPADRWARRPRLRRGTQPWRYLADERRLPANILEAAIAADILREGAYGSPWFAHHDECGRVTHVEIRSPHYRGSLTGGVKTLFQLPGAKPPFSRLVMTEAPIDALSIAAIEKLRPDTLYAATGGGIGRGSWQAIERILAGIAATSNGLFCSATDANTAGDLYAAKHKQIAAKIGVAFARLRPPIESGDWNDILKQQAQQGATL